MFSIHFLLCNLTISILLGIILLLKKLLKNYITTNSRYYLWYIFVCALIIPFIPFKNIGPHQLLIKLQHFFQQDTGKIVNTSTKQLDDINLSVMLLFTRHYPARCFGMNMPKSRDIQREFMRLA